MQKDTPGGIAMLVLDRIEGTIACISMEDGPLCADAALLAEGVKEGDVLYFADGLYRTDAAATQERRAAIRSRLKLLLNKK